MRLHDPFARTRSGFKIKNEGDRAEVLLYDEIGFFGVSAKDFVEKFNSIKSADIDLRINSPGGSVFEGLTIANAISRHKANVTVHVDGLAASIASVIAMSADKIVMAKNAYIMIHDPWGVVIGGAEAMRKEADLLDKVAGTIIQSYVDKTGEKSETIKQLMADETWFTADEAMDIGLADEIEDGKEVEDKFDLSIFSNAPSELINGGVKPSVRAIEKALRDVGLTQREAKAILSNGLPAIRDVEQENRDGAIENVAAKYLGAFKP